ncbi:hypothetical protein KV235_004143 [Escherichia coli]|nr:hypothetical protein [Escherichia coli]
MMEEVETVNFITAVRNAVFNESGAIDCEVQFEGAVDATGGRYGHLLRPHHQT